MTGTKLGSMGVVGGSNSPQVTSGYSHRVLQPPKQHFPRCYGLPFELLDWGKEALQYEKLIGHDVSELQFHLLVQLAPVPGTHFDPRE